MSFILDALRKSENERQRRAGPGLAAVPEAGKKRKGTLWVKALIVLLVINIAALLVVVLWPEQTVPTAAVATPVPKPPVQPAPTPPTQSELKPAPQVTATQDREIEPLGQQIAKTRPADPTREAATTAMSQTPVSVQPLVENTEVPELLPTDGELRAQGLISLPPLHVDIHVYADQPSDRFVFINMHKYREGERLEEGPNVDRITRDGVVLNHQGYRFLLQSE